MGDDQKQELLREILEAVEARQGKLWGAAPIIVTVLAGVLAVWIRVEVGLAKAATTDDLSLCATVDARLTERVGHLEKDMGEHRHVEFEVLGRVEERVIALREAISEVRDLLGRRDRNGLDR